MGDSPPVPRLGCAAPGQSEATSTDVLGAVEAGRPVGSGTAAA